MVDSRWEDDEIACVELDPDPAFIVRCVFSCCQLRAGLGVREDAGSLAVRDAWVI